jgi:hypothetical protein
MTNREKARDFIWSKIEVTERELQGLYREMKNCGPSDLIGIDKLEMMYESTERRLDMFNYLFKLIETDE